MPCFSSRGKRGGKSQGRHGGAQRVRSPLFLSLGSSSSRAFLAQLLGRLRSHLALMDQQVPRHRSSRVTDLTHPQANIAGYEPEGGPACFVRVCGMATVHGGWACVKRDRSQVLRSSVIEHVLFYAESPRLYP